MPSKCNFDPWLGIAITQFHMSTDSFWKMTFPEFVSAIISVNPDLAKYNKDFFDDEELAHLEKMKGM